MKTMLEMEEAIREIRNRIKMAGTESVPAVSAHGRILREPVTAPIDQPPWPRSPLDGYTFHAADSAGASPDHPVTLDVIGTVYAGGWPEMEVGPGQAVRIMTGAPIPADCDCVLRQEDTDLGKEKVQIYQALTPYQNYCHQGEDFQAGDVILPAGVRLNGAAMGILASAGLLREDVQLTVTRKVRCAVFCTGDELVAGDVRPLPPGKIYSSNAATIAARLSELGIEASVLAESVADDPAVLAERMREAAQSADLILTVGGVSVGEKDILHEALELFGAEKVFWKVRVKPGAPLIFSVGQCPVLSLSGNPFAASATFELFARPLLAALAGCEDLLPQQVTGTLENAFEKGGKMRRFVRAVYRNGKITLPDGHMSGQLASSAGTNCLVEIPGDGEAMPAGSEVKGWLL